MPFAVVNLVTIHDADSAASSARDIVIPRLRELPGFQQAQFLTDETNGMSIMVFETREQADQMASRLAGGQVPTPPGVVFQSQQVFQVVAQS